MKGKIPFKPLIFCALWILCSQLAFFYGMSKVRVAAGTVIDIGTTPIWTALFALVLFRKKPLLNWYLATALAITGLVLINGFSTSGINIYLFFPLLGGFCYAGYVTFSAALPKDVPQEVLMMLIMSAIALVLLPVMWFVLFSWTYSSLRGVSVSLGLGIVTGGMAFTLLLCGLQYISATVASTLCLAEPMGAPASASFY